MKKYILVKYPFDQSISDFEFKFEKNEFSLKESSEWQLESLSSHESGEMEQMQILISKNDEYKLLNESIEFQMIQPILDGSNKKQLMKKSKALLNTQRVPRVHPENLKLQSLPFGFDTGKKISFILEEYLVEKTLESYSHPHKKRKQ